MTVFDPYTAQQAAEAQAPKRAETAKQMFEREKAAVTCYEENWDDWDGPIWPKGTVQCVLKSPTTTEPKEKREMSPDAHMGDH